MGPLRSHIGAQLVGVCIEVGLGALVEEVEDVGVIAPTPDTCIGYVFCEEVPRPKHTVLVRPRILAVAR